MVIISEEIILKLLDLVIVVIAAGLAYFFGVKKLLKERELSRQENTLSRQESELYRKIDLYKQLIQDLAVVPELGNKGKEVKDKYTERLNRHGLELLQFAPDNVYREYMKVLSNMHKGAPITDLLEFMITLRKELIPNTTLKVDEIGEIERIE